MCTSLSSWWTLLPVLVLTCAHWKTSALGLQGALARLMLCLDMPALVPPLRTCMHRCEDTF